MNNSKYTGKFNKSEDSNGKTYEEELTSNTQEVLSKLKKSYNKEFRGISTASDLFKDLFELGVMGNNYIYEDYKRPYESWYITKEYAFLINDEYLIPCMNGFQWTHKGIDWLYKFYADKFNNGYKSHIDDQLYPSDLFSLLDDFNKKTIPF